MGIWLEPYKKAFKIMENPKSGLKIVAKNSNNTQIKKSEV